MKRYEAMRVMMSQLMSQATAFRSQYNSYKAQAAEFHNSHNYEAESKAYYMASLKFMKASGFNLNQGMKYMNIYRAYQAE